MKWNDIECETHEHRSLDSNAFLALFHQLILNEFRKVNCESKMKLFSNTLKIRYHSSRIMLTMMLFAFPVFFAAPVQNLPSGTNNPSYESASSTISTDSNRKERKIETISVANGAASFGVSALSGHTFTQPTSLQFGPDGRLYVLRKKSIVNVLEIERTAANTYQVLSEEVVNNVRSVANHDDNGTLNGDEKTRQGTGIAVTGTASNPVFYVASSDPRVGGHAGDPDTGLDTNSGVISRVTWLGTSRDDPAGVWEKVDIVRGLPRSEENHANNGLHLSLDGQTLYVAVGGFTNAGAPSVNFAHINEYALSAAILSIDLAAIEAMPTLVDAEGQAYKYDIPTLDDPERANVNGITDPTDPGYDGIDINDPWGGNDGLNQAKIVIGGPVQIHSPGYRNAYDLVITKTPGREGRMYTVDNGANRGWGGHPLGEGSYPGPTAGTCTNNYDPSEPGSSTPGPNDDTVNNENGLHFVRELQSGDENFVQAGEKYYAGHPTPIRANPAGAGLYTGDYKDDPLQNTGVWRDGNNPAFPLPVDWPPVPVSEANPAECDFRNAGVNDGSLVVYPISTNGIAEYTASNFDNAFKGNLFAVGYNENWVYRIELNEAGDQVLNGEEIFAQNFGNVTLDITTLGDDDAFPGTMWVTGFNEHAVYVFEPGDYDGGVIPECTAAADPLLDEDNDGYNNEDEIQNGADPCSAASTPHDNDHDFISDLNDPDDDNDDVIDILDAFAIDAQNGTDLNLPVNYPLLNEDPATGFFGLGLTGLMTNDVADYLDQFIAEDLIPGGTAGLFTVAQVTDGDATGSTNTQENAFQFGVNITEASGAFTVKVRMPGPFFNGVTPENDQAQGIYIGTGDMDNYLKLALHAFDGVGGMQVIHEENGVVIASNVVAAPAAAEATNLDLLLSVNAIDGTVQPYYTIDNGPLVQVGEALVVGGDLDAVLKGTYEVIPGTPSAMAVGLIATSAGAAPPFDATWDSIDITAGATIQSKLTSTPAAVAFGTVPMGGSSLQTLTLTNTLGNQKITISSVAISGEGAAAYSHEFTEPVIIPVGESTSLDIEFAPLTVGAMPGSLTFVHSGSNNPLTLELSGTGGEVGTASPILFRVNAGGPLLLDGDNPVWAEDQSVSGGSGVAGAGTPHPFVNAIATGDKTYGQDDPITFDASVPEGTPEAMFQRGRWDPAADPHMQWDIPIAVGKTVEVRLYFSEQLFTAPNVPSWATWPRIFDVELEGVLYPSLDNLDLFEEVGHDVGYMQSFVVKSDGNVEVDLPNLIGDPIIAGIEIVELTGAYSQMLEGWNLIGVPSLSTETHYESVFSSVVPQFAPFGWSATGYVQSENIAVGQAYWLRTLATGVQTYTGSGVNEMDLPLAAGWNMISGPDCTLSLDAISDPAGILIPGTLFAYDNGYQQATSVEGGKGYWVLADNAGTISMNCANSVEIAAKSASIYTDLGEDELFGSIDIADAKGQSQTLLFGDMLGEPATRRQYTLPPSAPEGSFDVRFVNGSRLMEGDQAIVQLTGVTYPVNAQITRIPDGFSGTALIESLVNGEVESSQLVLANDIVTIENERVTALRVRSVGELQGELPEQFAIQGNYPNPFNPQTTVVFDLPEDANVQVTLFDMLGRQVMSLPETAFSAGVGRQISVDASSLASGTYLYKVKADMAGRSEVHMGRMTLLK